MAFTCIPQCGRCCGTVPLPVEVYERNKSKVVNPPIKGLSDDFGNVHLATKNGFCVFLDEDKKCVIYEDRPEVCKEYGLTDDMPCPYVRPDGTVRCRQERRRVMRENTKRVRKQLRELKAIVGDDINLIQV